MDKYYNLPEYTDANTQFEDYLDSCKIIQDEHKEIGKLKVSTITITTPFCKDINLKTIYDNIKLNDEIIYIQFGKNNVRGVKKSAKVKESKTDKKVSFSNQLSVGIQCCDPEHNHKNPISIKIFKNGNMQMTGSKTIKEAEIMFNKLVKNLDPIENCVVDIKPFHEDNIQIEMINGTFIVNYKVDLEKLSNFFTSNYDQTDVYVNTEKKSPVACYLKRFGYIDERKKKEKTPSVFVYNSGAVNIISSSKEILYNSYDFMKDVFYKNYEEVVEKKFIFE